MSDDDELSTLEQRVVEKWLAAASARLTHLDVTAPGSDFSEWMGDFGPVEVPQFQFPRERWASYPAKRTVTLLACDRLLDNADELTDEQWMLLCLAMQYGGKTRIA